MNINLFPTKAAIWDLDLPKEFDESLYQDLMAVNKGHHTGEEIWNRNAHNIFDGSVPMATQLAEVALPKIQEFIGGNGRITHLQGREVVRKSGVEIQVHTDEDECHLQAVYFCNGAEFLRDKPLLQEVNQFCSNAFGICNSNWRASGFGGYLMPWEPPHKFWVKPHRGLLIAYDARTIHFQKPYNGDKPFMNILFNIKVETHDGIQHQGEESKHG